MERLDEEVLMAFNIHELSAEVANRGVLRPGKGLAEITVPQGLINAGLGQIGSALKLYCEGFNIPGVQIQTTDNRHYGYGSIEKKPLVPVFPDLILSFRHDGLGEVFTFFKEWMQLIIPFDLKDSGDLSERSGPLNALPFETSYKRDYAVDLILTAFNDAGGAAIRNRFRDAFPIYMSDTPFKWSSKNEYSKFEVVFAYYTWRTEAAIDYGAPGPF
jgi:hypothetical protein